MSSLNPNRNKPYEASHLRFCTLYLRIRRQLQRLQIHIRFDIGVVTIIPSSESYSNSLVIRRRILELKARNIKITSKKKEDIKQEMRSRQIFLFN